MKNNYSLLKNEKGKVIGLSGTCNGDDTMNPFMAQVLMNKVLMDEEKGVCYASECSSNFGDKCMTPLRRKNCKKRKLNKKEFRFKK